MIRVLSAMVSETRNPFARMVSGAAAAAAAARSFFRSARDPLIDSDQAAALASVDKRKWNAQLLKQLEWRRFEELCVAYFHARGFKANVAQSGRHAGVDIQLVAQGAQQASLAIQCKPWDAHRVGIKAA